MKDGPPVVRALWNLSELGGQCGLVGVKTIFHVPASLYVSQLHTGGLTPQQLVSRSVLEELI